ncbi:MAG: LysR family transcriptional regulator [Oscillospiraceae bacterium]|nr:LysR family transcriptional regulator [Oscillospiraceae bacterium]
MAKYKSFSEAARKLYISHSTTSRAVSALEKELDVKLFERNNHIVALTPAGQVMLEEAEKLLRAMDESVERVKAASETQDKH